MAGLGMCRSDFPGVVSWSWPRVAGMSTHTTLGLTRGAALAVVTADQDVVGGTQIHPQAVRRSGRTRRPGRPGHLRKGATALIVAAVTVLIGVQLHLAPQPQVMAPGPASATDGRAWSAHESTSSVVLGWLERF